MSRGIVLVTAGLIAALIAGCSSSPDPITDGSYQPLAWSELGALPTASLTITGDQATLVVEGVTTTATLGDSTSDYVLCPPDTTGPLRPLGSPITVGPLTLTQPAMFGDCGITSPERVTIVDLDAVDATASGFAFNRWVELCNVADPDC
jgi:hypothetical protein